MCSCIICAVYYHWSVSTDEILHIEPDLQVSFSGPQPHEGICSCKFGYPASHQQNDKSSKACILQALLSSHKRQKHPGWIESEFHSLFNCFLLRQEKDGAPV